MTEKDKEAGSHPEDGESSSAEGVNMPDTVEVKPNDTDSNDERIEVNEINGEDKDDHVTEVDAAHSGLEASESKSQKQARSPLFLVSLFVFVLVILLAALGGVGYWFWGQYQEDIAAIRQIQQETQAQIAANQKAFARVEQLNVVSSEQWQTAVSDLENLVVASAQRLNREANRTENRWPLEEALTLTRLAQQRLQLDASANVAIGLLKTADEIFASLDQAAVLPLRRQVANDILELQTTKAADVHGLYFQLDAIANQIKELNWLPKVTTQSDIPPSANPAEGFWHSLKQIVVVTKMDVPRQALPLLTDFEQWRQRSLLLVEQTQLALLAQNQLLFDAALSQTQSTLAQMDSQFDLTTVQDNLRLMQDAVLNPQWPALNKSAEAIEQYLAEQKRVVADEEVTE
jgi:uroporphyrin-3 C-methyltransferase